jgi:prepilin peptidase CpaA
MLYLISLACTCAYISYFDIRSRQISNTSVLGVLGLQCYLLIHSEIYLASAFAVLMVGLVFFWRRWLAAGDIKFAGALALAMPVSQLPTALILTGVLGGALSFFYLIINYWFPNRTERQVGIPYGVAISLGFCLVIVVNQVPQLLQA